jgi:hypothetical protein
VLYPIGMWKLNQKQSNYGLGLILSVFVVVLLAHLTAIQAVVSGLMKVDAKPSTALITRMIEPELQIESISAPVIPPKVQPVVKPESSKPKSTNQTTDSNKEVLPELPETGKISEVADMSSSLEPQRKDAPADPVIAESSTSVANSDTASTLFTAPQPTLQIYEVAFTRNGNTNYGKAELNWQHDGSIYNLSLVASYFGMDIFEQKSQGTSNATGLQPIRFSDKRYRKSEVAAHFNHELGKITFSANTPEAILLNGAQDRLSVIMQLAGMLAADPTRYGTGSTVSVQVASDKLAEPWLFAVENLETLAMGQEQSIARKVTRNPRREFDQKVELWFATEHNYAPVRFRFTETNGDYIDAILKSKLIRKIEY